MSGTLNLGSLGGWLGGHGSAGGTGGGYNTGGAGGYGTGTTGGTHPTAISPEAIAYIQKVNQYTAGPNDGFLSTGELKSVLNSAMFTPADKAKARYLLTNFKSFDFNPTYGLLGQVEVTAGLNRFHA